MAEISKEPIIELDESLHDLRDKIARTGFKTSNAEPISDDVWRLLEKNGCNIFILLGHDPELKDRRKNDPYLYFDESEVWRLFLVKNPTGEYYLRKKGEGRGGSNLPLFGPFLGNPTVMSADAASGLLLLLQRIHIVE